MTHTGQYPRYAMNALEFMYSCMFYFLCLEWDGLSPRTPRKGNVISRFNSTVDMTRHSLEIVSLLDNFKLCFVPSFIQGERFHDITEVTELSVSASGVI